MKSRIKKIIDQLGLFVLSIYKQSLYFLVLFSAWMAFEQTILSFIPGMNNWRNEMLGTSFAWLIVLSVLLIILCLLVLVPKVKRTYRPSRWIFANILLVIAIYTRYRFFSDVFVFWGEKYFCWFDILYLVLLAYLGLYIYHYVYKITDKSCEHLLLRDDAEDDATKDILGYDEQVGRLIKLLDTIDLSMRAYSVGVVGNWGVGKSTFLNMFAKQQTDKIIVRYNPRSAKTAIQIQEEFFNQLRSELGKYSGEIGFRLDKYAYALQVTTHSKWLYLFCDIFTNWTADSEKVKINQVIQSLGRRIYVIIEDLDRLTGEEILEVLKLIDANGNFSHIVFITAYDKKYVNRVLNNTLQLEDDHTDFTDKYFQYEFPLPQPKGEQLLKFIKTLVYDWAMSIIPQTDKKHLESEWNSICNHLLSNLPTIRQIKRYTNLLRSSYSFVKENVVFPDFALITLVRFLDNATYWKIYNRTYISNKHSFQTLDYYCLIDNYNKKSSLVTRIQNFDAILRYLFDTNEFQEYKRVCRVDSFENYFYDSWISSSIEQLVIDSQISTDDAIQKLSDILKNKNLHSKVIEFFSMCDVEWIGNSEHLFHYLCLLIYTNAICANSRLWLHLKRHMFSDFYHKYKEHFIVENENDYKNILCGAFDYMIKYVPYDVAGIMVNRLEGRRTFDVNDDDMILTSENEVTLALKAQLQYDNMYGTDQWNALKSLEIAQISNLSNRVLIQEAYEQINKMLNEHADEYAASILDVYSNSSENSKNKRSWIEAPKIDTLISNMRGHEEFKEWLGRIKSDDLRLIMRKLYEELLKNNVPRLQIPYISFEDERNYALIAEKINSIKTAVIEPL